MGVRRPAAAAAAILWLGLASCSPAARAVIRNASGADILLWPLGDRPVPLKAGETTPPIVHQAYRRQQAMIERGGCLYTYPAPDHSALPKVARRLSSAVAVVIREDMTMSIHPRSRKGAEGPEIVAAGFPLRPETFCGRRGEE